MNKIKYAFLGAATLFQLQASAQSTSCAGVTAPEVSNMHFSTYDISNVVWSPAPTITTSAANLPNVEFVVTKRGTYALDAAGNRDTTGGGGWVIIGADADGIIAPELFTNSAYGNNRYGIGLAMGDTVEITAVGYNLTQVKGLVDKILTGTLQTGATCCDVLDLIPDAAGFCDSLQAAGVSSSADVRGLVDVLKVFDAFSARQLSVEGLIASMSSVNAQGQSTLFPTECGKNDLPICYGINKNMRTSYRLGTVTGVANTNALSSFGIFPNPAQEGYVNVSLHLANQTDVAINIYNAVGQRVASHQLGQVQGLYNTTLSTAQLGAGMYLVELTDGQNKETRKLVVR